jgi:hypothetical protein
MGGLMRALLTLLLLAQYATFSLRHLLGDVVPQVSLLIRSFTPIA